MVVVVVVNTFAPPRPATEKNAAACAMSSAEHPDDREAASRRASTAAETSASVESRSRASRTASKARVHSSSPPHLSGWIETARRLNALCASAARAVSPRPRTSAYLPGGFMLAHAASTRLASSIACGVHRSSLDRGGWCIPVAMCDVILLVARQHKKIPRVQQTKKFLFPFFSCRTGHTNARVFYPVFRRFPAATTVAIAATAATANSRTSVESPANMQTSGSATKT